MKQLPTRFLKRMESLLGDDFSAFLKSYDEPPVKSFRVNTRKISVGDFEEICDFCTELIMPDTMRERKQIMEDKSDAFIIVPGGIGTFEEFFEILTLKQLCRHNKPIAIYNLNGYYNSLNLVLKEAIDKKFIREDCFELYKITDDLEELFSYLETPVKSVRTIKQLKDG